MAKYPKITVHTIEYNFTVGSQPFRILANSTDRITQVYRKEPGTPGWVKVFQDGVPCVSLESAMIILKSCLSVLKSGERLESD